jgi:site-specific DNA-methyltransferase (adenine-specific)
MKFNSNYRKVKHKKIENDDNLDWLSKFVKECYRVSKENSSGYIFCSFHFIDIFKYEFEQFFKIKNILVWEKNNTSMGDLKGDFAPKVEFIIFIQKGRVEINGKRDPNIFKFARTQNDLHPTQKPVDMFEYLIGKFSGENDLVFDAFAGSGTTAIACENTNRRWVCIEKDDEYAAKAIQRIKDHTSRLSG